MNLDRRITRFLFIVGGLCCFMLTSPAFADECSNLDANPRWNEGMTTLSAQLTAKRWDEALITAEKLSTICERSPMLNYAMGRIYREKGNDSKALYYYQRATLYTEEFTVRGKTLELMWFDRYEAEHPDARPENLESLKKELAELKQNAQVGSVETKYEMQQVYEDARGGYAAGLWTGVALGGVGLILTGVGAGGLAMNYNKGIDFDDEKAEANINPMRTTSLVLFGVGGGMLITGGILSGIMGYYYSHSKDNVDISFNVTPTSGSLCIVF
ncbi:MAG: tetratricopeptide repeat protein [Proteobacteria bacterium]|nr:tetratricopeptide repeat protein [Pseudomonadota bacterium]